MKFDEIEEIGRKSEEGAWVDGLAHFNGVAFKVRGQMNSDYEALFSKRWADIPAKLRDDPETNERIENECIVKCLLLDWKGIDDMECNPENVARALQIKTFKQAVVTASRIVASRGKDSLEDDAGN